jgi:hypothetical protein
MKRVSKHLVRLQEMADHLEARGAFSVTPRGTTYTRVVQYERNTGHLSGVRVSLPRQGRGRGSSQPG